MAQRDSALSTVTPRSLSGLAVVFLLFASIFALMNGQKLKAVRADAATPRALLPAKTTGAQQQDKAGETERAAKAEAALAQAEK